MQTIEGILFEPVGCLAEFPPEPFIEMAAQLFERPKRPSKSGSRAYWHLLNLLAETGQRDFVLESLELAAVDGASLYDDVIPALAELKAMGVKLCIASSLSGQAIAHFLQKHALTEFFCVVSSRDTARGIKTAPLRHALASVNLAPEGAMFLTDTVAGVDAAKSADLSPILMMNDPDEALRLTTHNPAGGIVSLHELPDFVRFVGAENARRLGGSLAKTLPAEELPT